MRIISGSQRGRRLAEFDGTGIRPTSDRAREAIFSILLSRFDSLHGLGILELFAGTGAMSLEALSRGARSAILIDSSLESIKLVTDNISRCKMENSTELIKQDVLAALSVVARKGPFDLIFMDPPYNQGLIPLVLEQISTLQLLQHDGIILAESAAKEQIELPDAFELDSTRTYGNSKIHLIKWNQRPLDEV